MLTVAESIVGPAGVELGILPEWQGAAAAAGQQWIWQQCSPDYETKFDQPEDMPIRRWDEIFIFIYLYLYLYIYIYCLNFCCCATEGLLETNILSVLWI